MTKKVLVTGASGFIGRHTLPLLLDYGFQVHAVSRRDPPGELKGNEVIWHKCDLLDETQQAELFKTVQPTHLLHFAWDIPPGQYWTSLGNLRWVQASLSLLLNFIAHGGKRVVMAGTCAEYDWGATSGDCSESKTPTVPSTLFGAAKKSVGELLQYVSKEAHISSAWGRIFCVYGPHEPPHRLVPAVTRALLQGEEVKVTHGKQIRDYLFVEDVASAFVKLLLSQVEGAINIASGIGVTLAEVIGSIVKESGHSELVKFGAIAAPAHDPPRVVADVGRLRSVVGWTPSYSLEQGIQKTVDWCRANLS